MLKTQEDHVMDLDLLLNMMPAKGRVPVTKHPSRPFFQNGNVYSTGRTSRNASKHVQTISYPIGLPEKL